MGRRAKNDPTAATVAEQKTRAYELSLMGYSLRKIAQIMTDEGMNISHNHVSKLLKEECKERVEPLVEEWRKKELDRLDLMLSKLMEQIINPGMMDRLARNVEVAVKLSERQAKLIGADKPIDVQITETTQADLALQDLINSVKATNALAGEASSKEQIN